MNVLARQPVFLLEKYNDIQFKGKIEEVVVDKEKPVSKHQKYPAVNKLIVYVINKNVVEKSVNIYVTEKFTYKDIKTTIIGNVLVITIKYNKHCCTSFIHLTTFSCVYNKTFYWDFEIENSIYKDFFPIKLLKNDLFSIITNRCTYLYDLDGRCVYKSTQYSHKQCPDCSSDKTINEHLRKVFNEYKNFKRIKNMRFIELIKEFSSVLKDTCTSNNINFEEISKIEKVQKLLTIPV